MEHWLLPEVILCYILSGAASLGGGAGVFMGQPGHIFPAGGAWIIPPLETQPAFDGKQEVLCSNV